MLKGMCETRYFFFVYRDKQSFGLCKWANDVFVRGQRAFGRIEVGLRIERGKQEILSASGGRLRMTLGEGLNSGMWRYCVVIYLSCKFIR